MAKVEKISNVTFRTLTNEEALKEFGSSFVFVGSRPSSLDQAAKVAGDRAVKRLAEELKRQTWTQVVQLDKETFYMPRQPLDHQEPAGIGADRESIGACQRAQMGS